MTSINLPIFESISLYFERTRCNPRQAVRLSGQIIDIDKKTPREIKRKVNQDHIMRQKTSGSL